MKKTITLSIAATFCFVVSVNAQVNKGSTLLGGTLSAYSTNLKNSDSSIYKQSNFSISPAVGFAINTNTVLGFSLLYGTNTNKSPSNFKTNSNTYGAGVFLRKYKLLAKDFYLFGEGNLMFDYTRYNYSNNYGSQVEYDSKSYEVSLNVTPGIAYSLTRKLQLEAGLQNLLSIGYAGSTETSKNNDYPDLKRSSFGLSSSLNPTIFDNVFIGLRFLINK